MRRLKTNVWRPPLISKHDLGVGTPLVAAENKNEIPPFVGTVPFLCACVAPILVRGVSAYFNNYFNSI